MMRGQTEEYREMMRGQTEEYRVNMSAHLERCEKQHIMKKHMIYFSRTGIDISPCTFCQYAVFKVTRITFLLYVYFGHFLN